MPKQQFEKSIFSEGDCRADKKVCNEIMHILRTVLVIFPVWNLVYISICKWTPQLEKKTFFPGEMFPYTKQNWNNSWRMRQRETDLSENPALSPRSENLCSPAAFVHKCITQTAVLPRRFCGNVPFVLTQMCTYIKLHIKIFSFSTELEL